jgi:hypothetical protein
MAKSDDNQVTLSFKKDKFSEFVDKLSDLTKINESSKDFIKIRIDSENIFMYSLYGASAVLAFKSYLLDAKEFINFGDNDNEYELVVTNAKQFVKNISFFDSSKDIDVEMKVKKSDENFHVRAITFKDKRLTIKCIGGEMHKMLADIRKEQLSGMLDPDNIVWKFKMDKKVFDDIKKLSSINSDNKVINIGVDTGKIYFSEDSRWNLNIDEEEYKHKNCNLTFGKKYLSSISIENDFEVQVFENFILFKNDDSNLMVSFEQSWDDEIK